MELIDYKVYRLSKKEQVIYGFAWIMVLTFLSYLFYHSLIPVLFFSPTLIPYYKFLAIFLKEHRKSILCKQFKEAISSMATALETGCSIENAIWDAYLQVSVIFSSKSFMAMELMAIHNQLKLSIPIEDAFEKLSLRTDDVDIITFCEIVKIAKRTDGNLVQIITSTAETIGEKFDIRREIQMNINGKRFELIIMSIMPALIILYMKLTSPGFFEPLYHNITGITFVTICLIFYCISILLSVKISRIEV